MDVAAALDAAIARTRSGDIDAYRTVVEVAATAVRRWIAVRVPPGLDPDELCHDAFVEAFDHLDRYQTGTNAVAWLIGIARHVVLMRVRRLARERRKSLPLSEQLVWDDAARQLENEVDDDSERRLDALRKCLAALPEAARQLIEQRYRDGTTMEVLADEHGRSAGALRVHLHGVRRRLAACIATRLRGAS